jgi:hypothetical protein
MVSSLFDIITVSVSKGRIKFLVYKAVLQKSSKFFDNAMKPKWASFRSDVRTIDLTEEDPTICVGPTTFPPGPRASSPILRNFALRRVRPRHYSLART